MQPIVLMYLAYVALSVGLTIWVAHTLSRSGRVFLVDVFRGNDELADSVNHLLVVGFYLINFGYVALALRTTELVDTSRAAVETLSWKVGLVLLVLGGMHFFNMFIFSRMRRRTTLRDAAPPVLPDEMLTPDGQSAACVV
jgi:hypothetical protein